MKMQDYTQAIENALRNDDPLDTAWELTELGMHVLPVRCTAEKDTGKEKIPVYPYSSRNTLTVEDDAEEFEEAFKNPRYGVALSPHIGCGVIIIDADTPEEVNALQQWWMDTTGEDLPTPTVITPGMQDENGNWEHSNGGHWYISYLPAIAKHVDAMTYSKNANVEYGDSHFNVRVQGSYNILPPSRRSTGSYKMVEHIINGMQKTTDETTTVAHKLFGYCKKKTQSFSHKEIDNVERFTTGGQDTVFDFPADMSLQDKLTVWVETLGAINIVESTGRFSPDNSSTCGGECVSLHYEGSTQSRSAVVHGRGCTAAPHGTITIFSDSLRTELDTQKDVVSVWTLVKHLKYNGDTQEAIHGEGLHTDMKSGSAEWMKSKFSKYKK